MSKERSFRVERRGDSHFGVAEGFRAKRLLLKGSSTVAGDYLRSKGVHLPTDRLNKTVRTVFRGNSEYAFTESGSTVRLHNPDGGLTARGLAGAAPNGRRARRRRTRAPTLQSRSRAQGAPPHGHRCWLLHRNGDPRLLKYIPYTSSVSKLNLTNPHERS